MPREAERPQSLEYIVHSYRKNMFQKKKKKMHELTEEK